MCIPTCHDDTIPDRNPVDPADLFGVGQLLCSKATAVFNGKTSRIPLEPDLFGRSSKPSAANVHLMCRAT